MTGLTPCLVTYMTFKDMFVMFDGRRINFAVFLVWIGKAVRGSRGSEK